MACEPSPSCGGRPASAGLLLRVDRPRGCRRPLPGRNARALGRWAACRDRAVPSTPFGAPAPSTPFDAPASRPPEPFRAGARLTVIANWTARPPIPRCPVVRIWQRSPPTLPSQPRRHPRRGFWYSAHFRHGTRLCVTGSFGAGGSGARRPSLPSPSPFACPLGSPCGSALRAPPSSRSPLSSQAGAQIHGLR